jgi:hypothetical protein
VIYHCRSSIKTATELLASNEGGTTQVASGRVVDSLVYYKIAVGKALGLNPGRPSLISLSNFKGLV